MASLLTIPEEIRDKIIEDLLLHEREPPPDVAHAEISHMKGMELDYGQLRSWPYGPSHVRF